MEERRGAYRVNYDKEALRPDFLSGNDIYLVADISPQYIKIKGLDIPQGNCISGKLMTHQFEAIELAGTITRKEGDESVVQLDEELSAKVIQEEIKYIVQEIRQGSARFKKYEDFDKEPVEVMELD